MNQILSELFVAFEQPMQSPKEQAAFRDADSIVARLGHKLTAQELDELWSAAMEVALADVESCFAHGFRMGARVMLAVLDEGA